MDHSQLLLSGTLGTVYHPLRTMFAAHNLRYDDSYPTMPARNRNTCSRRYVLSSAGVLALLFFAILTFGRSIPAPRQLRWRSDLSDDIANSTLGVGLDNDQINLLQW